MKESREEKGGEQVVIVVKNKRNTATCIETHTMYNTHVQWNLANLETSEIRTLHNYSGHLLWSQMLHLHVN